MKYYCEVCEKEVDDQGPYEMSSGDYCCQDCMEYCEAKYETMKD